LLVSVAVMLEPFSNGVPVGRLTAFAFIITELISIGENANALGLPMPRVIIEWLEKAKENARQRVDQKLPPPPTKKEE
jgi:phage-related holin